MSELEIERVVLGSTPVLALKLAERARLQPKSRRG